MWDTLIFWSVLTFLIIMPLFWAVRDSLAFPANKRDSNLWHTIGFTLRAAPSMLIINDLYLILAYGFYFWIVFELFIGKLTKNNWFYQDKSTLSGEILSSFYLNGKVICAIKFVFMIIFLTIKYI